MQIKKYNPTDHKIKSVVYGASGVGKTVFAATAPKPIFASAEGGLLSIADKMPDFVEIKTLTDLKDMLSYLKTEKHGYETVVIDSITEINDIIKMEIEKKTGKTMQLQDWGTLSKEIKSILRGFRDLPMHVLFIAQEAMDKDGENIVKVIPSLNGKSGTEIAYFMDIVGYMFVANDGSRKITTGTNQKLLSKDRSGIIDSSVMDFSKWCEQIKAIKKGSQDLVKEFTPKKEELDLSGFQKKDE